MSYSRLATLTFFLVSSALAGCSGDDDLFEASNKITPDSIFGVWAASATAGGSTVDARFKFTQTEITSSARCVIAGKKSDVSVTVPARVSESSIEILESKSDTDGECKADIRAGHIERCAAGATEDCFEVDGTALTLRAPGGVAITMTKVSD